MQADTLTPSAIPGPPSESDWRLFAPDLDAESHEVLRRLLKLPRQEAIAEIQGFAYLNRQDSLAAQKALVASLLLRDLLRIGWEFCVDSHSIHVRPPKGHGGVSRKESIRQQLLFGRDDQLTEEANRRFILSLENPTKYASTKPITELIADGHRLAQQLKAVIEVPVPQRISLLQSICQPYLQLVTDERDEYTNIRLIDIWRYFRHSWVTRYRSTPGRNLFYLVRDAAQPNHPVMGIAALGNTVMQLTPRDRALGWTTTGLIELIERGFVQDLEVLEAFRRRLEEDFDQIYRDDLPVSSGINDCLDEETLSKLAVIEEDAQKDREQALRNEDEGTAERPNDLSPEQLLLLTRSPLYRWKRARALKEILRAYRTVANWSGSIRDLSTTDEGLWAIGLVIKQLKKRYSATSMMEITVCGAVAPYNHLLGGKLVCLMMLSSQVVSDYRDRYNGVVSIIASQMAGRPITKEPLLAFLGTTSLYTDHSAQYNRVRLPAGTLPGQRLTLAYMQLGRTEGFGSPNLSSETELCLARMSQASRNYRNVNFLFGEGQSPKLRQLREGFSALGLNQTNLLQHGAPRIIYGMPLIGNVERYLLGVDSVPQYAVEPSLPDSDKKIATYWVERWLLSRLNHSPAIEAVQNSTPQGERVSRLIPAITHPSSGQLAVIDSEQPRTPAMQIDVKAEEKLRFIRLLYRNESAFSDHVSISRLKELNIKTKLEEVVRKVVRNGGSVVITGNAGDGKTHTILLMKGDLKGAEVITDASELSGEEIAARWQAARDQGKPFCIAINEGPLVDLVRGYREKHPWLEDIRTNLLKLVTYRPLEDDQDEPDDSWKPMHGETIVVDLSQRKVLSSDLISSIIEKLTDDQWFQACQACPSHGDCPVTYNRAMLRSERTKERMVTLLTTVGKRGIRATFREVLAYVSYLIFGGRTCEELKQLSGSELGRYYWNAFEGEGVIFETLSHGIDPLKQTNPLVDENLWRGILDPTCFTGNITEPVLQRNLDLISEKDPQCNVRDDFTALKRRWYFEHTDGRLFDFSDANRLFSDLQDTQLAMAIRLSRLITLINRWWNRAESTKADALRVWTRLSYSPRPRSQAMVSGLAVNRNRLRLYKPVLAPMLRRAFGDQPIDHLLLASADSPGFTRLIITPELLSVLLHGSVLEGQDDFSRRLTQFNDSLAKYGEKSSDVRHIEVHDPHSELRTTVVVDLANRRFDSAN